MNKQITVDFLGTRGAFPLNIPETQKLGTETSCVLLSCEDDRIILDAGTGLNHIEPTQQNDIILLSHFHYDHVLGLPYFLSRKKQGRVTLVTACAADKEHFSEKLSSIFGGIGFPAALSDIFQEIELVVGHQKQIISLDVWKTGSIALNHPGGSIGYSVTHQKTDKRVCYLMDHEHSPSYETAALTKFANGADLVIYDAAYSEKDYQPHQGFGHSTIEEGQRFKTQSKCRRIVFTGHAMERLDSEIMPITEKLDTETEILAHDGLSISL